MQRAEREKPVISLVKEVDKPLSQHVTKLLLLVRSAAVALRGGMEGEEGGHREALEQEEEGEEEEGLQYRNGRSEKCK
ncbi:hypothetical protein E2C01_093663 [Portunus trituberculatus]|uniref:Uncharacterized protein n=1 Tax=Portunus trituberculatus TaxID=210409 RepID=A0A5B7JU50_PORTR|nr:hypothetical protein [Portunus trituberculatus]